MGVDRAQITEIVITPDRVENAFAGQGDGAVVFEIDQQFVFFWRQIDRAVADQHLAAQLVDGQRAELLERCSGAAFAFEQRAHTRRQYDRGKRFGDVIVRAVLQSAHLIGILCAGSQQHDRQMLVPALLRAQLAQHFKAIHAGHHHVQNGKIQTGMPVFQYLQGFASVGSFHNAVPVAFQKVADQAADARLVIGNQNRRHYIPPLC